MTSNEKGTKLFLDKFLSTFKNLFFLGSVKLIPLDISSITISSIDQRSIKL